MSEAELLLKAGAVLPHGTEGAGPTAVDLTARAYRHPALGEDRVVVRLAAAELGVAEDLAAGFLGLVPEEGEPPVVGLGHRQELGFPEWVLVHHPEDGHHALAVVPELDRIARQAKTKPKAALDACHELAGRLGAAVPHFLPVFHEQAARIFLAVENTTYAAQLFGRARTAEAQHGLSIDEDRLDAVFLEFALAGALPVKVLTGYGKELAVRVSPTEAHERFRRLCVRRTAGGLPPSAQAATELRRLARAAGLTGTEPEQEYLAELLPLPATLRAATGWWKAHRGALVALARRVPSVRGTLLGLTPPGGGDSVELTGLWLDILVESGATAGLESEDLPAEQRCADGTAGWLERFHAARHAGWGQRPTPAVLLDVVERCAGRLRTELARPGREAGLRVGVQDADLLDLLLTLGIPVADPDVKESRHRHDQLNLQDWARADQRRDLLAVAADERFHPAFHSALNSLGDGGNDIIRRVAASPGGRPLLTEWMRGVARSSAAAGLPGVPDAIRRLTWLPTEALELAPEEVAAAAAADLAETLARTLRGGLFEELTWPSWESAVAELGSVQDRRGLTIAEAWPYLIVANSTQVRVIDADSTVLDHDLRVPTGSQYRYGFHYVDGELLVFWNSWSTNETQGYWHTSPGTVFTLDTDRHHWQLRSEHLSLPLPDGGRAVGGGVLHRGDTKLPDERAMLSDGTSCWVWQQRDHTTEKGWREYDPVTGDLGRYSLPGFLTDTLDGHPVQGGSPGYSCRLRPTPTVPGSVLGAPSGGLLGWRTVRIPGHGWRGADTSGRTVTVPEGGNAPLAALTFPGDDRPRALSSNYRELRISDPDGVITAQSRGDERRVPFATGSVDLPPLSHWYALRPRDPEGSAALRTADRETVGALLKSAAAATKADDLPALVSTALPQVTAPELISGIIEVLRFALVQQKALDKIAARLRPDAETADTGSQGPTDQLIDRALSGLTGTGYYHWGSDTDVAHRFLRELAAARADSAAAGVPGRLHFDMPQLPYSALPWTPLLDQPAAVAYRAVAAGTTDEERAAVISLLREIDALGLASAEGSADRWRRVLVHLDQRHLSTPDGVERALNGRSVLPLGGGAVLATTEHSESVPDGHEFGALLHDPTGRFTVPGPYTLRGDAPLGDPERGPDWLARFLTEAADRGPAPFVPEAAEEFARLTGVSRALARLVVAGLPFVESLGNGHFLPAELRSLLDIKAADAVPARDELKSLDVVVRRAVVAALLPADPALLWTEGPDAAAAAEVWNRRVGRRTPVPDWLLTEASRVVRTGWAVPRALSAILNPALSTELSVDVAWTVRGDHVEPREPAITPFTSAVLTGAMGMMAWLAHRLPAGDPVRAALPPALTAVRRRLAAPELLLNSGHYIELTDFRKAAGTPTETGEGYERYGAVIMATQDNRPRPALRPALLDSTGSDPYLAVMRGDDQRPSAVETALRAAHDQSFAALLADPGAPAAGAVDKDGTWWPQDPSRSVPELVGEAADAHGLGADAAALYLMLLAMPDPTDRNTARWTGWKPARLKAARAELAATDLVVSASRSRAGRSLFLPGGWVDMAFPVLPAEQWKLPMYGHTLQAPLVPAEPAADLYRRAWQRVREGDVPRFGELKVKRTRARRR
ncbi:DNA-binding protein [Streptomyces sp. NPDC048269]|uniref:DNA-binding protein n=1 Tax=Streptomyces sp. NPDC048269 TaxID=3155753 RepID=UPI0034374C2A